LFIFQFFNNYLHKWHVNSKENIFRWFHDLMYLSFLLILLYNHHKLKLLILGSNFIVVCRDIRIKFLKNFTSIITWSSVTP
jgi:hypothetical protein